MSATSVELRDQSAELLSKLPDSWMSLSHLEQAIATTIYRLLATGIPVSWDRLVERLGIDIALVDETLDKWPAVYYDEEGQIVGFWGLAIPKMAHQFEVNGKTLYAWCAWDALFIPELIQGTARVVSKCAETGDELRLTVGPDGILKTEPEGIHVSLPVAPDEQEMLDDVITNFCHLVYFFRSEDAGKRWNAGRPDTFIVPVTEAFELGKRKNEIQFSNALKNEAA